VRSTHTHTVVFTVVFTHTHTHTEATRTQRPQDTAMHTVDARTGWGGRRGRLCDPRTRTRTQRPQDTAKKKKKKKKTYRRGSCGRPCRLGRARSPRHTAPNRRGQWVGAGSVRTVSSFRREEGAAATRLSACAPATTITHPHTHTHTHVATPALCTMSRRTCPPLTPTPQAGKRSHEESTPAHCIFGYDTVRSSSFTPTHPPRLAPPHTHRYWLDITSDRC
jgi:hypothetical protein